MTQYTPPSVFLAVPAPLSESPPGGWQIGFITHVLSFFQTSFPFPIHILILDTRSPRKFLDKIRATKSVKMSTSTLDTPTLVFPVIAIFCVVIHVIMERTIAIRSKFVILQVFVVFLVGPCHTLCPKPVTFTSFSVSLPRSQTLTIASIGREFSSVRPPILSASPSLKITVSGETPILRISTLEISSEISTLKILTLDITAL